MSVTGTGEVSRRTSFLVLISIVTILMAALAMPALAHHDPADGPEVAPTQEDFPGGEPNCPEGTVGGRINDPDTGDEATVQLSGGASATFHVISITDDELTFEVEGGLAAVVFVKGGTDGQNVYDYSGMAGGGIAHDDGLIVPTGQGISHFDFCLVAAPAETPTPSPTPSNPALNIRKENEEGRPLAGAVFMVEGSDEHFTTGDNGKVCITELNGQPLEDRPYLVTEITPPPGYALPAEPSQLVEPDNDGQGLCDSPDAIFVDPTATPTPSPTPTPTPSPTPSESEGGGTPTPTPTPSPTPRESELGGTPTPSPTPRESELGGNPTPSVPDTAMEEGAIGTSTAPVVALFAILALALLTYARLAVGRARR